MSDNDQYRGSITILKHKAFLDWLIHILSHNAVFQNSHDEEKLIDDSIKITKFIVELIEFPIPKAIAEFDFYQEQLNCAGKFIIYWDNKYYSHENLFETFFSYCSNKLITEIHNAFNDKLSVYGYKDFHYFLHICNLKIISLMNGRSKINLPANM